MNVKAEIEVELMKQCDEKLLSKDNNCCYSICRYCRIDLLKSKLIEARQEIDSLRKDSDYFRDQFSEGE